MSALLFSIAQLSKTGRLEYPLRKPNKGPCRVAIDKSAQQRKDASDKRIIKAFGGESLTIKMAAARLKTTHQNLRYKIKDMVKRGVLVEAGEVKDGKYTSILYRVKLSSEEKKDEI